MKVIRNIIVAFSLYSQIPMPGFEWKDEDMKHTIVFLPWVGVVIGLISWGLYALLKSTELPLICRIAIYSLVPLVITGGFHVDGYMDVQDALRSYKSKQEKLEILKDPHIGAFAIIRMMIYSLVWMGAMAVIVDNNNVAWMYSYFVIFSLARVMTAITSLRFKHAKDNGMLHMETHKSGVIDLVMCIVQLIILLALTGCISWIAMIVIVCVVAVHFLYYKRLCEKQFGGVTGDTAGFCIVSLEEWLLVALAILSYCI